MPRLLTRTSAEVTCCRNESTPAEVPRSAATPRASAFGTRWRIFPRAAATRASVRPLITTLAPSAAKAMAIASPIPAVEPDTTAVLSCSSRFIPCLRSVAEEWLSLDQNIERISVVLARSNQRCVNRRVKHLNGERVPIRSQGGAENQRGHRQSAEQQAPSRPET